MCPCVRVPRSSFLVRQKQPGEEGFLTPSLLADGSGRAKVLYPEMLIGMLLEMGSGSKKTPKGGLKDLLEARVPRRLGDIRLRMVTADSKKVLGKFGAGAYKDEPWSIVAMRKRVYAVRAFYGVHLQGEQKGIDKNPGWADDVVGTLNSFALLLGTKPQHVPKVCASTRSAHAPWERSVACSDECGV